jgi:hypothetical protein
LVLSYQWECLMWQSKQRTKALHLSFFTSFSLCFSMLEKIVPIIYTDLSRESLN